MLREADEVQLGIALLFVLVVLLGGAAIGWKLDLEQRLERIERRLVEAPLCQDVGGRR